MTYSGMTTTWMAVMRAFLGAVVTLCAHALVCTCSALAGAVAGTGLGLLLLLRVLTRGLVLIVTAHAFGAPLAAIPGGKANRQENST